MVQRGTQRAEDTVGGGTAAPYRVLVAVALGQSVGHCSQPVPQLLGGQSLHRHSAQLRQHVQAAGTFSRGHSTLATAGLQVVQIIRHGLGHRHGCTRLRLRHWAQGEVLCLGEA